MRLLYVLIMALFVEFPLLAQPAATATVDAWIDSSPADGSWSAGGDIYYGGDPYCDYCTLDVTLSLFVEENGAIVADPYGTYGTDPNGSVSLKYLSPTIIELNTPYYVEADGAWTDSYGTEALESDTSITTPGIPSIALRGVDASSPPFAQWSYTTYPNGGQSLYSSTVVIGNQAAISYSTENPTFTFDQSQYPGVTDEPITTPVTFQGYLAGHFFDGPTTNVTVWLNKTVTDYATSNLTEGTEITGGVPTVLSTTHAATENFDLYTYPPFLLFTSLPEYVVHMNFGHATIDTHNNICTPTGPAECEIALVGEVNRWPFPPYPAANNDPMSRVPITIFPDHTDNTNLWALEVDYYGLWLQEGTGFAVCNTLLQVYAYSGGTPDLSPMGCIGLTLP